jgi:basic membrane protein A
VVDSTTSFRLSVENLVKRLLLILCLALAAALAGCGGDDDGGGGEAATTTGGEERLKVALNTDAGQLNDRGFNQLAFQGLVRAGNELGVETRVIESRSAADYVPNMSTLARQGFDLIIGVGFAQGDAIARVAKTFPDTKFVIVDVDQSTLPGAPDNVVGMLFREEQVGYLAGYLAGLQLLRDAGEEAVVSSVGGFKEPPVDRFIAGYQAGAKDAAAGVEALNGYSQDWDDQAKCKELALNQIQRGSKVVFQVAGGCGLGALDAAREREVWGIGVDADQSFLGPHILTSALKKVDEGVFRVIQSVQEDTWQGGQNLTFGLAEDGVGLGTISPRVSQQDRRQVERIAQEIADGNIDIPRELSGE